jgi:hypothetical protein
MPLRRTIVSAAPGFRSQPQSIKTAWSARQLGDQLHEKEVSGGDPIGGGHILGALITIV